MDLKVTGVILKHRNLGEHDSVITILTRELGLIEAIAPRMQSKKSKLKFDCQLFCYSEFDLTKIKGNYRVASAQAINSFYGLRLDVTRVALAGYFCEVTCRLAPTPEITNAFLNLLLNCLTILEAGKKPTILIKSIFELRGISIAGFMPDLICCKDCCIYESSKMYFVPYEGQIVCGDCLKNESPLHYLPASVLLAMRHVIFSDHKKIYSFIIADRELVYLNTITQQYLLLNTEGKFKSLKVYQDLIKLDQTTSIPPKESE